MIFDSDGNSGEFVDLVAEDLNYLGPKDLTQYFIRQTSMNKTMKGSIRVEVVLGRRLLGTVLTVYIPTILLIFIAHTTNYFKSFFFEAVVSVNLTVMLVNKCLFSSNHPFIFRCWPPCSSLSLKPCPRHLTSRWWMFGSSSI